MTRRGVALSKRLAVSTLVAVVVAGAVALPAPTGTGAPPDRERLDAPAYDAESLAATPIPAAGDVDVDANVDAGGDGVVVVDATHSNRFDRADIEPLVEELAALGYRVRIHDGDRNLYNALTGASAFVVVDPAESFAPNEVITVRTFTRTGGHLLLVGEPTRRRISSGFTGLSVSTQESALTTLASRYDMALGTRYLTNTETNGGNYKHVVATSPSESGLDADRVVLFTAAAVHSRGGTVLLRAAADTREAGGDGSRRYPVAVHKPRANVVLVGDSSFLRADRVTVADNEAFAAFLVGFLVGGEPVSRTPVSGDDAVSGGGDTPATPSPGPSNTTTTTTTAITTATRAPAATPVQTRTPTASPPTDVTTDAERSR